MWVMHAAGAEDEGMEGHIAYRGSPITNIIHYIYIIVSSVFTGREGVGQDREGGGLYNKG